MALGNEYDNNNGANKKYSPNVYSPYKMSNPEGIDPSALTFTFWNNLLKIGISPRKPNSDPAAYDYDKSIEVYINHTKARMLYEEIFTLKQSKGEINNVCINTGIDGIIMVSNGKEFGVTTPVLVIIKHDEKGNPISSYVYQFKTDKFFSMRNFNMEKPTEFEKIYFNDIELDQFSTILKEYYEAMTCATAYTVIDQSKYNNSRMTTKINAIMDKMGIKQEGGKANYSKGSSFFNNSDVGNASYRHSTIDDINGESLDD